MIFRTRARREAFYRDGLNSRLSLRGNCASTCFFGIMECDRDADRLFYWSAIFCRCVRSELCRRIFSERRERFPFDVVAQQLCAGYILDGFGDVLHFSDTTSFGVSSLGARACPQSFAVNRHIKLAYGYSKLLARLDNREHHRKAAPERE